MAIVGGGIIRDYKFSLAWGVNPSAASGTVLLDTVGGGASSFDLEVGDYVVYSFGSLATFHGIVTETSGIADAGSGATHAFSIADNRIRLAWQMVYGAWNIEDRVPSKSIARPAAPAIGGDSSGHGSDTVDTSSGLGVLPDLVGAGALSDPGDQPGLVRRYKHLLPQHWESGIWTWTDEPYSAREILNSAFNNAWGDYGFTRSYHSSLSSFYPIGVDHSSGVKLSSLVGEINEKAGLDVAIDGARNLVWGRKGEGLLPLPDLYCSPYSSGQSLTGNDTKVRITGERIRVQVLNVELVPDWKPGWEAFIDEVAWRREVAETFELPMVTKSDWADIAAYALEVTVYQYASRKGDPTLCDYATYGNSSRMNMSAWSYIQQFVFRSYRIPRDFSLYGVPLSSLELADSLLCSTGIQGEGAAAKQVYADSPAQFYPNARVQAIQKGVPLDLLETRDIALFYKNSTRNFSEEWTMAGDFEVDAENFSLRFGSPVFAEMAGSGGSSGALYLRMNRGEGDGSSDLTSLVGDDDDYLDIVVPNPDFSISAASVKASFCFLLGRFHRDHGTGPRRGGISMSGLDLHVLDMSDAGGFSHGNLGTLSGSVLRVPSPPSSIKEILYEGGDSAVSIADESAAAVLIGGAVQASGGFTRNGIVGTALSPVVDRIDVSIEFGSGVTEVVSYTKARPTGTALAERTLQRIQRTGDLYPGYDQLRREARDYRVMAVLERNAKATPNPAKKSPRSFADVFRTPVGGENSTTAALFDKNSQAPTRAGGARWQAGDIVWKDAQGYPVQGGGVFAGVLVASPYSSGGASPKNLVVATMGLVPVRCAPGIQGGAVVMANPGANVGAATGSVSIGTLHHQTSVPSAPSGEVLAMVRLGSGGGGGGAVAKTPPLTIATTRPFYIPAPAEAAAEGVKRVWFHWGSCAAMLPVNWQAYFDCAQGAPDGPPAYEGGPPVPIISRWFWAKINLTNTAILTVSSWEIVSGTTANAFQNAAWPSGGARPTVYYHPLGHVFHNGTVFNTGGGSLLVSEHVTNVANSATPGVAAITRSIVVQREGY